MTGWKWGDKKNETNQYSDITIDAVIERGRPVAAAAGFLPGL